MKPHRVTKKYAHPVFLTLLFLLCPLIFNCGDLADDAGENFGNILDSPNSLELTEEEHVPGWGREDCLMCHNLNNIHRNNLTDIDLDVEAIQDLTYEQGEGICMNCHGTNGTE